MVKMSEEIRLGDYNAFVNYIETQNEADDVCSFLMKHLEGNKSPLIISGIDCEWDMYGPRSMFICYFTKIINQIIILDQELALIQLCLRTSEDDNDEVPEVYLFHVANYSTKITKSMKELLDKVHLVGVNVGNDVKKLKQYGYDAYIEDLGSLYQHRSLDYICQSVLNVQLDKSKHLQKSCWTERLSIAKKNYAAIDALAPFAIYKQLTSRK